MARFTKILSIASFCVTLSYGTITTANPTTAMQDCLAEYISNVCETRCHYSEDASCQSNCEGDEATQACHQKLLGIEESGQMPTTPNTAF